MDRIRQNDLIYYQFTTLRHLSELSHGIFTRRGGVSPAPFDSLNVGLTVGDDEQCVHENRRRMSDALGVSEPETRTTWQVHGTDVLLARHGDAAAWPPPKADAIITSDPYLPLTMRFADCVPLLLYDPVKRAIGLAHAGWRGTVSGVAQATIRAMASAFGTRPGDVLAGIGPSIGPCCYEVGPEVVVQVRDAFPEAPDLIHPAEGSYGPHFDLWAANERALRQAGVQSIDRANLCTACHTHEFFSHRAEAGRTGRFGALVSLRNGRG